MTGTIALDEELQSVLVDQAAPEEPFYMLLLGCDGRPGESAYRSDTIILVRVDPVNKTVTMLSIPRDTMVTYKGSTMKINAAHFYEHKAKGFGEDGWDIQKIDIGIALAHFEIGAGEAGLKPVLKIEDPKLDLPENTRYIASFIW